MSAISEHEVDREMRRFFRRFIEEQSYAAKVGADEIGLFVVRNKWSKPVIRIGAGIWVEFERRGFLAEKEGRRHSPCWLPSELGRARLRRLEAKRDPFHAQHQIRIRRAAALGDATAWSEVNDTETTLAWLHRRRKADGRPLVSKLQVDAGERLRRDFTLAKMSPRVTMNWSVAIGPNGGGGMPYDPSDLTDHAIAARRRLTHALRAVGPGLSDILVEICCNSRGLEESERGLGWPQRAGKVVLEIALDRLAAHYEASG